MIRKERIAEHLRPRLLAQCVLDPERERLVGDRGLLALFPPHSIAHDLDVVEERKVRVMLENGVNEDGLGDGIVHLQGAFRDIAVLPSGGVGLASNRVALVVVRDELRL